MAVTDYVSLSPKGGGGAGSPPPPPSKSSVTGSYTVECDLGKVIHTHLHLSPSIGI